MQQPHDHATSLGQYFVRKLATIFVFFFQNFFFAEFSRIVGFFFSGEFLQETQIQSQHLKNECKRLTRVGFERATSRWADRTVNYTRLRIVHVPFKLVGDFFFLSRSLEVFLFVFNIERCLYTQRFFLDNRRKIGHLDNRARHPILWESYQTPHGVPIEFCHVLLFTCVSDGAPGETHASFRPCRFPYREQVDPGSRGSPPLFEKNIMI